MARDHAHHGHDGAALTPCWHDQGNAGRAIVLVVVMLAVMP